MGMGTKKLEYDKEVRIVLAGLSVLGIMVGC